MLPPFTLGSLFRFVTLASAALGWVLFVQTASPEMVFTLVFTVGNILGIITACRRVGTPFVRSRTLFLFVAGAVMLAFYSASVASLLQPAVEDNSQWAGLGTLIEAAALNIFFPVIAIIGTLMFRSWVWAANDQEIHDRHD